MRLSPGCKHGGCEWLEGGSGNSTVSRAEEHEEQGVDRVSEKSEKRSRMADQEQEWFQSLLGETSSNECSIDRAQVAATRPATLK